MFTSRRARTRTTSSLSSRRTRPTSTAMPTLLSVATRHSCVALRKHKIAFLPPLPSLHARTYVLRLRVLRTAVLPNYTCVFVSKMAATLKLFKSRNLFSSGIFFIPFYKIIYFFCLKINAEILGSKWEGKISNLKAWLTSGRDWE